METKISLLTVTNEATADEASRTLGLFHDWFKKFSLIDFGYGWTYKGGVYTVYIYFEDYAEYRRFVKMGCLTLTLIDLNDMGALSAGALTCSACRHRAACTIDPNRCGYWI